jgi:hypothetical protein
MQIDESDEHPENTSGSIDESLEPDSNVTVERDSHAEKQLLESLSTEAGMQIDESEQSQNADSSINKSLEPDSNVAVERDRHPPKHPGQSFSTEEGMQTDEKDEQR